MRSSMHTESRRVVARGWGNGCRVSFGVTEVLWGSVKPRQQNTVSALTATQL